MLALLLNFIKNKITGIKYSDIGRAYQLHSTGDLTSGRFKRGKQLNSITRNCVQYIYVHL